MIRDVDVLELIRTFPYVCDMFTGGLSLRDVREGFGTNSVRSWPLDLVRAEYGN